MTTPTPIAWWNWRREGMRAHLELVEAPDLDLDPLTLDYVRDHHLRALNATSEDDFITRLMKVTLRQGEKSTRRAWLPQTWRYVAEHPPRGFEDLVLPKPPLISVDSIDYIDTDGNRQTWDGSPLPYDVSAPSGPEAGYARIRPVYGTCWPLTRCQLDAFRVTFQCGYAAIGSPAVADVPEDLTHGRLLLIGELFKSRSESLPVAPNAALIRAEAFWAQYRVY